MGTPVRRRFASASAAPLRGGAFIVALRLAAPATRFAWAAGLAVAAGLLGCSGGAPPPKPAGPTVLMSDPLPAAPGKPGEPARPAAPAPPPAPKPRDPVREVEATFGILAEGPAVLLVREVGARVAAASPRREVPYRFGVVDRPEPNAFALPSGHIYVSRGLLALLNGEDELAGVLGHEVAHVAAHHVEARERQALAASLLSLLATLAGGFASDARSAALAGPAGQAAAAASVAAFSRDQEREADQLGQHYARAAGFAEDGLALALRALDHERRLREGASAIPEFFETHPGGAERFASAAARVMDAHGGGASEEERLAFLQRLDGLVVGADPAQGIFRGARFLHPGLDITLRFPESWRAVDTPTAVIAFAPEGDAAMALELARPFPSLDATVRADIAARGLEATSFERLRIGDAPAVRVIGLAAVGSGSPWGQGSVEAMDVTWIERRDGVYRVTGRAREDRFLRHAGVFLATAKSVRRLTAREREGVSVLRLRLARAEGEESLAAFAKRSGTSWAPSQIALANGLAQGSVLPAPRTLKVAIAEPWRPAPSPAEPDPR